jgi:hypothetical protein
LDRFDVSRNTRLVCVCFYIINTWPYCSIDCVFLVILFRRKPRSIQ